MTQWSTFLIGGLVFWQTGASIATWYEGNNLLAGVYFLYGMSNVLLLFIHLKTMGYI